VVCEAIGVTPYAPKPLTSGAKAEGRFRKQDLTYVADHDVYRCPAGNLLRHHMTTSRRAWCCTDTGTAPAARPAR
jgi:hypothetical protein